MNLLATIVGFVAFHGGAADHFAVFSDCLEKEGIEVRIYALGPAFSKLKDRFNVEQFSEDEIEQIAKECAGYDVVVTDVGHRLDVVLQEALEKRAPLSVRCCYYDNQEKFVPGGYSETAAKVMALADRVFFANANLVDDPAFQKLKEKVAIGYYSVGQAEKIAQMRKSHKGATRKALLEKLGLEENGQKLLVLIGGNNSIYFEKALPAFLQIAKNSNQLFLVQQHPGAVASGIEQVLIQGTGVHLSPVSSEESLVAADGALYYQTSMAPLFLLAGIPTMQVGHEPYEDFLVSHKLCPSITNQKEWEIALKGLDDAPLINQERVLQEIGFRKDWKERLLKSVLTP